ncbi:DUF2490 domain containing protein [Flavobacterium beibuense]|uniref:DUF2490 domain containing protein n=2 Tax=Flavobacterium beibuense TaxID=657326 RepID=A0A444W928_9FLAO|nr:DUF2490 domain containing protein [Flavobacterium beibuense]
MPISGNNKKKWLYLFLLTGFAVYSQTENYMQFWNEYAFVKDINEKWSLEADMGITTSGIPEHNNIFYNLIQFYGRGWAHYYPSERVKISFFYAFFYNTNVPELLQDKSPEHRLATQFTYLMTKTRLRTNLRGRLEDRHLENDAGYFEAVMRLRMQAKATYPLNGPIIKPGVVYAFMSDEVMFKTRSSISGNTFFDRNRLTVGFGYSFVNEFQVELSYVNELLPRPDKTSSYDAIQVNVVFTDLFSDLFKGKFKREKTAIDK